MIAPLPARQDGLQAEFDFLLAHCYPLITVGEAAWLLDCSEDAIIYQIDEGTLRAIDIQGDAEMRGRRCLRLWRWCVIHRAMRPGMPLADVPAQETLPHSRPYYLARELAAILRCTPSHVGNLTDARILTGPDLRQGRPVSGRSPRIERESLLRFLRARAIS